nr:MAG TPA: hypothetical protein [Caudoviricetes sp.]
MNYGISRLSLYISKVKSFYKNIFSLLLGVETV